MAGDWIKVEHATIDKPEVALFSELLGVPVAQGFGLLVMFWMWCDRNSRNGLVTHTSRLSIDTITHTQGFSAALEAIGWGQFNESARTLTLPNFTRHNENTAKTRAQGQKRAKEFRNADVTLDRYETVTREEKRRVTNTEREKLTAPTEEHFKIAAERGLSCADEFQKYRDWQASTGKVHKSEVAGFRNWLKNAKQYAPVSRPGFAGKPNQHDKRAATAAAMFGPLGAVNDEPNDITAESTRVA